MHEPIIGIDLGTTNSAVGIVESGFPILLANQQNQRIIPSAVWYGDDGEVIVGEKATRHLKSGQGQVVTSIKRLMGADSNDHIKFPLPYTFSQNIPQITLDNQQVSPQEVSAEILKELKKQAENQLGYPVSKAVITVPAYFNDKQRNATIEAAKIASLEVVRIVSEPTAAALAFGLDKLSETSKVIVYDLGGGTFDVSLLELSGGVFKVLATSGDTQLGGDHFDYLLAEHIYTEVGNGTFEQLTSLQKHAILAAAKSCKEALTNKEEYEVFLPFFKDNHSHSLIITRETFEKLITPLLQKTLQHCKQVLHDAEIKSSEKEISSIVLVGGSTRIPAIHQLIKKFFNKAPDTSQHPDEAVGLGAVIQAGILSGSIRDLVLLDVTPLSLGIETYGGLMNIIMPRNTTIPCKAGEMFTNAIDQQSSMKVKILQGEREMARDNWEIGMTTIPFKPLPKGQARVGIQFSIDENGILDVLTRDTATSTDTHLSIQSAAVDVEDDKVEKMVSESIEHAFSDMEERVFTEAKLKALELIPAIDIALSQVGNKLDKPEYLEINDLKSLVLESMEKKNANQLKENVEKLDKKTEYLATILIESAFEKSLENKLK